MSRLVARLLLSLLLLPIAALGFIATYSFIDNEGDQLFQRGFTEVEEYALCGIVTYGIVIVYWWVLWGRSVSWVGLRSFLTVASIPGAAVVGTGLYYLLALAGGRKGPVFVGSAATPVLWVLATVFLWRETAAERSARLKQSTGAGGAGVSCPTCGYNLTGLTATRCPECGSQFTLDELLASQPGREGAELEA